VLLGECLGGALYTQDFIRLARAAGFTDPRCLESEVVSSGAWVAVMCVFVWGVGGVMVVVCGGWGLHTPALLWEPWGVAVSQL
jgi:hypothetical protein